MRREDAGPAAAPDPLARDLPVSLHARIAAALESEIRDGRREPGDPLPTGRALADRLGVHRHTVAAAYARLEARGLVRARAGHPPVVRAPGARPGACPEGAKSTGTDRAGADAAAETAEWIARALESARRRGIPRDDALRALHDGLASVRHREVTLYEPRPGMRAALAAELAEIVGSRLRAAPAPRPRIGARAGAALLRAELWPRLAARLPEIERIPVRLGGGGREVERILRELPRPCVVVLLTRSRAVRRFATELAASAHGHGVTLATPDPTDRPAVERAGRVAALLLADASCAGAVPPTRATVRRLRLVAEPEVDRLRRYFGEPEVRSGVDVRSRGGGSAG